MDEVWLGFHGFQGVPSLILLQKLPLPLTLGLDIWVDVGLYLWGFPPSFDPYLISDQDLAKGTTKVNSYFLFVVACFGVVWYGDGVEMGYFYAAQAQTQCPPALDW